MGYLIGSIFGATGNEIREAIRESRLDALESIVEVDRGPQHSRLHDMQEQCRHPLQGYEPHQQLWCSTWAAIHQFHHVVLWPSIGPSYHGTQ